MKANTLAALAALTSALMSGRASAQAPEELSFLTNRPAFASWAVRQVDSITAAVTQTAAGSPDHATWTARDFIYNGPASFTAMARSISGTVFQLPTPIPESTTLVNIRLGNRLPDGNWQGLFEGFISGRAEYDGTNWRLPAEQSAPSLLLEWRIFIPAPGITAAWVVETNSWGRPVKKMLDVWEGQGFYFENSLAGEVFLCLEFANGSSPEQWTYNLHDRGLKQQLSIVLVAISLRDSEDVRDYGDNPTDMYHWLYTYKPDNSTLTYGKVPLLIANYTTTTVTRIKVTSAVGQATQYVATRIEDGRKFTITVPPGATSVSYTFAPGLYHTVPLGINVCADWWNINDVDGWSYGKGGVVVPVTPVSSGGGGGVGIVELGK